MSKILIANRGEIARRIIAACRRLDLRSVAVFSEADADLPFVAEADEAVAIGPAAARESYLKPERIVAAIAETGATAVHPGYGFLAENADFADMVAGSGATWIGPRPETIRAMGDKGRARAIAEAAGVPVVPGSDRFAEGETDGLETAGDAVGYPLLVKASAGGGGIGMQRVDRPEDLAKTARATQSMAAKAFGDGTVFLERLIPTARHVEMQVFGYGDGSGVHLFERDCSLQRRYQKVIEEAPGPGLAADTRTRMAEAALALVRETRYAGAGTVEFIVDAATEEFFFLEMNTRIQVEHPVTEMITGRDLVAMQIAHALDGHGGARLAQDGIAQCGVSIECRLYAESPAKKFFPSPGTLERLRLPAPDDTLRIDAAYAEGNTITPYYDPLIAKIVAAGPDRAAAIARAIEALEATEVAGPNTNRDFLIACLRHPEFAAGQVHTGFIDTHLADLAPKT
ncbi:MAG: biotin carboxylase N-terminal domain-containing protein [Paracoccaceae bacterium]|nr:biotin carboxylase N-terminal domain-containing protein [Paracoccaceae bacterium]